MKIIDYPILKSESMYDTALHKKVDLLKTISGVSSIYQIGSVTTPGISDIDLLVIFKDNFYFFEDIMKDNNEIEKYLFTHKSYGINIHNFKQSTKFTFFHNYKILYGKEYDLKNPLKESEKKELKIQIALEYLVKMFINLSIQKEYQIIKLRSTFLHIKALLYDFEFLSYYPKQLVKQIEIGLEYRKKWFTNSVSDNDFIIWFNQFYELFEVELKNILRDNILYFERDKFLTSKNVEIRSSDKLSYTRNGFLFRINLPISEKRNFNINNRINRFSFEIPSSQNFSSQIKSYFSYCKNIDIYNEKYIPNFMTLSSSLNK